MELSARRLRQVGRLVYQWVRHSVEKYGRAEVETWWWEVWNEPDIGYWHGTPEEYQKLYDYAADGLKRALPTARIGGPHVTGPNGQRSQEFLRGFLEHCVRGTNYATGKTGSPLDYVGFHAKGAPRVTSDGFVRMNLGNQLRAIDNALTDRHVVPRAHANAGHYRRVGSRRMRRLSRLDEPVERLSQWHDVLELHRRTARTDL